jgi:calpain family cysteine protease
MDPVSSAQRRDDACVDDVDGSSTKGTPATVPDRVRRMAAQAIYDLYAAGGLRGPVDCSKHEDADRCGTETVSKPVLFLKERDDTDAVDRADVTQAKLNDCHLMAALAALASTPAGRELIKSAITENRNDKGEVVSYTVTLHEPQDHLWGPRTFSEVKLTVDDRFAANHAAARRGENQQSEIWPLVIEKAYAQYQGGYGEIDGQGSPARAMEILTGKPAADIPLDASPGYGADRLACDLAAGKLVVLLTKRSFDGAGPVGIVANHGYSVADARSVGGKLMVQLHNPWNDSTKEPRPIAYEDLAKWFVSADVGSVR